MAHAPCEALTPSSGTSNPRKLNRSCQGCTHRKVKCDGRQPCATCVYYRASDTCTYRQRSKRNAVSRSSYEKLNEQLQECSGILGALFPSVAHHYLVGKSRSELLSILCPRALSPPLSLPEAVSETLSLSYLDLGISDYEIESTEGDESTAISGDDYYPYDRQWHESLRQPEAALASDDINAISLASDQHTHSYLGVTSMSAVFRVIFRLYPLSRQHAASCARIWASMPTHVAAMSALDQDPEIDFMRERRCIDFYFEHVHPIIPLVDEVDFHARYNSGERTENSWIGLINMIFCLGSIAAGSDCHHEQYYQRARTCLNLESLGTGNMDALQALCLLSGFYLHYRNSPNMAYSLVGAAHRMAIALGLHRELRRCKPQCLSSEAERLYQRRAETRRRTWWSLFCLDTWASMSQGRPTCGRWDNATMDILLPQPLDQADQVAVSLAASARLCLTCNQIQHRFAQCRRLSTHEVQDFDGQLAAWWGSLPPLITDLNIAAPRLDGAREFIRTRYHNARLILLRSSILYYADHRLESRSEPLADLQTLVHGASEVAKEAIDSITQYWTPNRFQVWNSAWYLFQACAVPLLCLALIQSAPQCAPSHAVAAWQASLSKAIATFSEMRSLMRASDRSPDIVAVLAEALKADMAGVGQAPILHDGSCDGGLFSVSDEFLTGIDWSSYFADPAMVQDMFPLLDLGS